MTERQVASSYAKNISTSLRRDGDEYVLNGTVSSGIVSQYRAGVDVMCRNGGSVARRTRGINCEYGWESSPLE